MRFAPKVQVLVAPVSLMAEQLVDVLALLEKQEKEEEARMDLLENMILEGKSVSAADKEAWRRWARAGGTKRKRKKRRKRKLPRCPRPQASLRHAARVPAAQVRDYGGASAPVHRQSVLVIPVVTQRRGTHSANRADLRRVSTGAVLAQGCALLCGATTGFWSRQCRKPWSFCRCSSWTRLRRARRALTTGFWSRQCRKPSLQFLDKVVACPSCFNDRRLLQTVQKTVEFPRGAVLGHGCWLARCGCLPQRQVRTVPNCAGDREDFTGAVLGSVGRARRRATTGAGDGPCKLCGNLWSFHSSTLARAHFELDVLGFF